MRVIPPPLTQPQEIVEKPSINNVLEAKAIEEVKNNGEMTAIPAPIESNQNKTIYKTREFKKYIKLCKEGKYISARITAKALGINPVTLIEWNKRKEVQTAIQENVDSCVEGMKRVGSKDWKMYDKLIDRAIDATDKDTEHTTTLNNLIQINI